MSVNIKKLHGAEGFHLLRHDFREANTHGNTDIDVAKRSSNKAYYMTGERTNGASGAYEKLKTRIAEIDKAEPPVRKRKDRVTMVSFVIPVPSGLPEASYDDFFKMAYIRVAKMCGGRQNVSPIVIHNDEIHDYIDPTTRQLRSSRTHAHVIGIPYVPGKGINAKSFLTRKSMRKLQQDIDRDCRKRFHVPFLTGEKTHSKETVEQLKDASQKAAQELLERIEASLEKQDYLEYAHPDIAEEYKRYLEYLEYDQLSAEDTLDLFRDSAEPDRESGR